MQRRILAGWRSAVKVFSSGFVVHWGFLKTHLDGLAKLPTIPPRCIAPEEWCGEMNQSAFSVYRKDAKNRVGWTVWQEAKDR
ncbi:MAG TPA: hypothetical protein DDZ24_09230 [Planctomycetaceae bacterium]|nr:hypothetical protein [Planctomycetaceae bacterium]